MTYKKCACCGHDTKAVKPAPKIEDKCQYCGMDATNAETIN